MELSVVVPYLTEEKDKEFFENLEQFCSKLRSEGVKLELVIACSSSKATLLHKAHLFAGNLPYAHVAFTRPRDSKSVIASGLHKCNRNISLIVDSNFLCEDIDCIDLLSKFENTKRFNCYSISSTLGKRIGLLGKSFDLRVVADCLTAKSFDEVFKQFIVFHQRWGTCTEFKGSSYYELNEDVLSFNFFEKSRLIDFVRKCMQHYISYSFKVSSVKC